MKHSLNNRLEQLIKSVVLQLKEIPPKTLRLQFLILGLSLLLSCVCFVREQSAGPRNGNVLNRESYGGNEKNFSFSVHGLLPEEVSVDVSVSPRLYTRAEANQVFEKVFARMETEILNGNQDLLHIQKDLSLPDYLPEYGVFLSWNFLPDRNLPEEIGAISASGTVANEDLPEGQPLKGTLELTQSLNILSKDQREEGQRLRSDIYRYPVMIYPVELTERQRLLQLLKRTIQEENQKSITRDSLKLPAEIEGRKLRFREKQQHSWYFFPLLGLAAAIFLYARQRNEQEEARKKRKNSLTLDYPELVSKIMVYLGAGLTVRNALTRISHHYDEQVSTGREDHPLYEELRISCRQLEQNMPESQVYLALGTRTDLKCYTRLISLIEQNRKNGSRYLSQQLTLEMNEAFEERKNTAKRLGEEASTKLLLPLFLQLFIVMIVVLYPALSAMH